MRLKFREESSRRHRVRINLMRCLAPVTDHVPWLCLRASTSSFLVDIGDSGPRTLYCFEAKRGVGA